MPPGAHVVYMQQAPVEDYTCAQVGCFLSFFIPLVGCATWCVNSDAPEGSRRRQLAGQACCIAVIPFFLYLILTYYEVYRS